MIGDASSGAAKEFAHRPVMVSEVVENLRPASGDTVVDVTLGGGGHASLLVERIGSSGTLIGIDRDEDALEAARSNLEPKAGGLKLIHGRMGDVGRIVSELGFDGVDRILADLGVSSYQFDVGGRGFSIRNAGPLDMRMDRSCGASARDLIRESDQVELERIIRDFGEERFAGRISRAIAGRDIETTDELARIVESAVPRRGPRQRIHPATRVFQALRIEVNDELGELERFLDTAPGLLKPGGRLVIISYHSLEDRKVKWAFRELAKGEGFSLPRRKALKPADEEVDSNPRARSAKLRTLERTS